MQTRPDLLKIAIVAAGGRKAVAARLGITASAVDDWRTRGLIPERHRQTVCAMGGNIVTPEALAAFLRRRTDEPDRVAA